MAMAMSETIPNPREYTIDFPRFLLRGPLIAEYFDKMLKAAALVKEPHAIVIQDEAVPSTSEMQTSEELVIERSRLEKIVIERLRLFDHLYMIAYQTMMTPMIMDVMDFLEPFVYCIAMYASDDYIEKLKAFSNTPYENYQRLQPIIDNQDNTHARDFLESLIGG
jgi:hypothetical protein